MGTLGGDDGLPPHCQGQGQERSQTPTANLPPSWTWASYQSTQHPPRARKTNLTRVQEAIDCPDQGADPPTAWGPGGITETNPRREGAGRVTGASANVATFPPAPWLACSKVGAEPQG